jgi:hypothetical protein
MSCQADELRPFRAVVALLACAVLINISLQFSEFMKVVAQNLSDIKGKDHPITGHQGPRGGVEV